MLLYINSQRVDLAAGQVIARTLQVNDLNSLDDRQAGYTNKFKLPKTANNLRILQFLAMPGNTSGVPYTHNECSLYSDAGECFVYKGRAVVTDGGEDFEAVVYDGITSLFKAIEGYNLGQLDLTDIAHVKNYASITGSWSNEWDYRYIVADYNGNLGPHDTAAPLPVLYTDYLVPSVRVKYLWGKIAQKFGFTYEGSVFGTEKFRNLWMAYPRGVSSADNDTVVLEGGVIGHYNLPNGFRWKTFPLQYREAPEGHLDGIINNMHFRVAKGGRYRLEVFGNINTNNGVNISYAKNAEYILPGNAAFTTITPSQPPEQDFHHTVYLNLAQYECIMVALRDRDGRHSFVFESDTTTISLRLTLINEENLDFAAALMDFPVADFLKEIVHRFGLTIFKDRYTNTYRFLTLQEQLEQAPVLDWSQKLAKKISENYIYGSHAQQNWLRYNYSDKESSHNDGCILVPNVNLPATRDVIKSKLYSPELTPVTYLNRSVNVYRLWDKEPQEDGTYSYKSLDKRYYFLGSQNVPGTIYIDNLASPGAHTSSFCCFEKWDGLSFADVVQERYQPLRKILGNTKIITAELWLSEPDVANFDFRTLYYFEQLGGYYLMNKISNYVPGKPAKCELVEVKDIYNTRPAPPALKITKVAVSGQTMAVHYQLSVAATHVQLQVSADNQATWQTKTYGTGVNPLPHAFAANGTYHVRLEVNGEQTPATAVTITGKSFTKSL